jgi:hypothetical protein
MAVFTFDESSIKTREKLKLKDFKCHLELETYPGHGFHVYFDQMDLDKDQVIFLGILHSNLQQNI